MAMIAVPTPPPSSAFTKDHWDARSSDYSQPRTESRTVALPSIRQAIPELHLTTDAERQVHPHAQYHPQSWAPSGPSASSEYICSPAGKRRRISNEMESMIISSRHVPRLYPSPERPVSSHISPATQRPPSAEDSWRSQASTNYNAPVSVSPEFSHHEHRHSLHSLPPPGLERSHGGYYSEEYTPRQGIENQPRSHSNGSPVFGSQAYDYNGRYHHISAGSIRVEDRSPFAPSRYSMPPHDASGRYGDMGLMGMVGDAKQRKRRGNLPKETTDKLRSWFVAHLQHPYPTEDEKQDLMRQTGLQMNQISNWFINARRRQLPTMINNARAETDAMHSRSAAADGASVGSTDRSEMDAPGLERESTYDASPRMHGVHSLKRD